MRSRIPKQFQGGGQDMNSMIHQAKKMQDQIAALQEDIESRTFSASAGGGAVNVVVTGKKTVQSIELKPEVVTPDDIEMLQDLVIGAVNECLREIETKTNAEMERITGGLNVPGVF